MSRTEGIAERHVLPPIPPLSDQQMACWKTPGWLRLRLHETGGKEESARFRRTALVLVLLSMLVGTFLRWYGIHSKGLWFDEFWSLSLASGQDPHLSNDIALVHKTTYYRNLTALEPTYYSQRLFTLLRDDAHPPLYYLLLNLWMHLFGTSEASLRSLSLMASVACIPLIYALGRKLFSVEAGVYAAFFFSLVPFQIAYAVEARSYALMLFFTMLSTLLALRLCEGKGEWRWLIAHGFVVLLGLFTHYIFLWNLLFQWILVMFHQRRNRPFLLRWGLSQACVMASFAFWLPTMIAQIYSVRGDNRPYAGALPLLQAVRQAGRNMALFFSGGRIEGACQSIDSVKDCVRGSPLQKMSSILNRTFFTVPVLLLSACAWKCFLHFRTRVSNRSLSKRGFVVCLLWSLVILAGTLTVDAVLGQHTIRQPKYMISASVPLYLLLAGLLTFSLGKRVRQCVFLTIVVFLLATSGLYLRNLTEIKVGQGFREAAEYLNRRADPSDLVLVWDSGPTLLGLAYYLKVDLNLAEVARAEDISLHMKKLDALPRQVWFLAPQKPPFRAHLLSLCQAWLQSHLQQISTADFERLELMAFSTSEM